MQDAIYARQSIEKKDSISIDSQIEMCARRADPEPLIFRDAGYSGKNTKRPAFRQMMEDVRCGKIKRIFCYRLDRISRSVIDFNLLQQQLEQYGVEFVSVTESFDTSTPMGRAMQQITAAFAQMERETIAERINIKYYARTRAGAWGGGTAPYGFRLDRQPIDGKLCSVLAPCPEETEIVRDLFEQYASGTVSLGSLARQLNASGVPAGLRRSRWTALGIRDTLSNPVHAIADVDLYSYYVALGAEPSADVMSFDGQHAAVLIGSRSAADRKRRSIKDTTLSLTYHRGYVPSALFISVQQRLAENQQIKNSHQSTVTWLSGLLKCAHCGYSILAQSTNKSVTRPFLKCSGHTHAGVCDVRSIAFHPEDIEQIVLPQMQQRIIDLTQSSADAAPAAPDPEINAKKARLVQIESEIKNLIDSLKLVGAAAGRAVSAELEHLSAEQESLSREIADSIQPTGLPAGLELLDDVESLSFDDKRTVARILIDRIVVGDTIQVIWKN